MTNDTADTSEFSSTCPIPPDQASTNTSSECRIRSAHAPQFSCATHDVVFEYLASLSQHYANEEHDLGVRSASLHCWNACREIAGQRLIHAKQLLKGRGELIRTSWCHQLSHLSEVLYGRDIGGYLPDRVDGDCDS